MVWYHAESFWCDTDLAHIALLVQCFEFSALNSANSFDSSVNLISYKNQNPIISLIFTFMFPLLNQCWWHCDWWYQNHSAVMIRHWPYSSMVIMANQLNKSLSTLLLGEYRLFCGNRVDILHSVGNSVNPMVTGLTSYGIQHGKNTLKGKKHIERDKTVSR